MLMTTKNPIFFFLRSSLSKMIFLLNIARICVEHRGALKTQPKILAFCQNSERLSDLLFLWLKYQSMREAFNFDGLLWIF